ncbi:uncharacterized protein [Montipora foliosa]|uniref:uncharacterized protein n=1 Tax=Montipora foliosa TaxID=591990 RepID=UPI0035F1E850
MQAMVFSTTKSLMKITAIDSGSGLTGSHLEWGFEASHKEQRRFYSRATNHDSSAEGQSIKQILRHWYAEKVLWVRYQFSQAEQCIAKGQPMQMSRMNHPRVPVPPNYGWMRPPPNSSVAAGVNMPMPGSRPWNPTTSSCEACKKFGEVLPFGVAVVM